METSKKEISIKKSKFNGFIKFILIASTILILSSFIINLLFQERVNLVLMGIEGTRSDTIIFLSIDTKTNTVDAISIPRDTYYPTAGKDGLGQKKINAVYGFKNIGGSEGVVNAVSDLLDVSIDYYVNVDYDGVASIVDMVGGVQVDVPFEMKYDDPYASPPLHIDFQAGVQKISGEHAIEYLRFRKSSDGTVKEGDVQRIERQQAFLLSAVKSFIQPNLPLITARGLSYVDSNMPLYEAILIGTSMIGMNADSVNFQTIPMRTIGNGDDGLSYFFHDEKATKQLIAQIMNQ